MNKIKEYGEWSSLSLIFMQPYVQDKWNKVPEEEEIGSRMEVGSRVLAKRRMPDD